MSRGPYRQGVRPYEPAGRFGGQSGIARSIPPVLVQPSQPGAMGPEQGTYVRLPGADFAPAGAIPVDEVGDANLAPSGVGVLVTIAIPDTYRLRIAGIGFGADDETAVGFLSWSVRANTDTVPGYVNKPAAIGSIRQLAEVFIVQGSSASVTIQANIASTAVLTYRYICRVRGWFWSEKEIG